ncbi:MAG: hypothetical protein IBJ03_10435 [Gemmatimonadaceae bacterium]|nr:hypothetical protein [Gemmatimonadaceae bacterium]
MASAPGSNVIAFLNNYRTNIVRGFYARFRRHTPEIYSNETTEAIWGLVARQTVLALELTNNPGIWNRHIGPVALRAMVDVHITLAWILMDSEQRSREYIRYGLGQEKLLIEQLKDDVKTSPSTRKKRLGRAITSKRRWLESQLLEWAIEVNVGAWSGKSVREMAQEAGCDRLYKFAYVPLSGAAHSMWQSVGRHNMSYCANPLHKFHRVPILTSFDPDPRYLYKSARHLSRTYLLISQRLDLPAKVPLPARYFRRNNPFFADED